MAKRFIDSELFKKDFLRSLKAPYKLLWVYLFCDCSHAGIWECEFDIAEIRLSQKIDWGQARKLFSKAIIEIENGAKWFIPSFIDFQYTQLSETNPAHNNIIKILNKYNLLDASLKPLQSTLQGTMVMEKEKEMVKEKEKGKKPDEKNELIYPFDTTNFKNAWNRWIEYRREIKKPYQSIKSQEQALKSLSRFNEEFAIQLIEKSITNSWQGLIFGSTEADFKKFSSNGKTTLRPKDTIGTIEQMQSQKL